jgi:peptidyl-prolyl cis-trans isomerase SurA
MKTLLIASLLSACFSLSATAATAGAAAAPRVKAVPLDSIVALINDDVITRRELKGRQEIVEAQLKRQGTTLPAQDVLERQVLDRMITDRVQLQQARESGIRIDDQQLDQTLVRIAESNKMSLADFRATLERDGLTWARFRDDVREEMTIARLREREVDQRMLVSDPEIDAFLEKEAQGGAANEEVELAHILIRVPESATPEVLQQRQARAEEARAKLLAGDSFAQVAAAYSDAPDGLQGGKIGSRKLDRLPTLYAEAVSPLAVGALTPLLRSPNGFHIITVLGRKGGSALPPVQQTRVRHILIRPSEVLSEAEARHRLSGLRERLINGASFAELSRLHSQDGTAAKAGELGWIYPGDTVPEFERAMDALPIGKLSEPVQSPFGWHLIEVMERRVADVSSERRRLMARQAIRERRSGEAYQDWIRQLRDRAYVELRLDEK